MLSRFQITFSLAKRDRKFWPVRSPKLYRKFRTLWKMRKRRARRASPSLPPAARSSKAGGGRFSRKPIKNLKIRRKETTIRPFSNRKNLNSFNKESIKTLEEISKNRKLLMLERYSATKAKMTFPKI